MLGIINNGKKKIVALAVAMLMCISVLAVANLNIVYAQEGASKADVRDGYWSDGMTEKPAIGYEESADGKTIRISSAEGLAWLSVQSNGLNGVTANTFVGTKIYLETDIDLSGKYWYPIGIYGGEVGGYTQFSGQFDGQGHTISNMCIPIF